MKKKKKSLKKLSLNKNVISSLENGQINGGTGFSVWICPIPSLFNCPILTPACPILTPACPTDTIIDCPIQTLDCSFAGCPSDRTCF